MKHSHAKLNVALKLQAIEQARRLAAELSLGEARAAADRTQREQRHAESALKEAEEDWTNCLKRRRLDISLQLAFAGQIDVRERDLSVSNNAQTEAERLLDQRRSSWQLLEASVRSGDILLRRWRRDVARRSAERRDQELADRTSWNWYER